MDLNLLAETFIEKNDGQGLAQCIACSLDPKRILQLIHQEKKYELLQAAMPLLVTYAKLDKELVQDIYIGVLTSQNLAYLSWFPKDLPLNWVEIIEQTIGEGVDLYAFTKVEGYWLNEGLYFRYILQEDNEKLFLLHHERISVVLDLPDLAVSFSAFNILKHLKFDTEPLCKTALSVVLEKSYNRQWEPFLIDWCARYDFQDLLKECFATFFRDRDIQFLRLCLRLGLQLDEATILVYKSLNEKLFARVFTEDV